jgi:hypothetical protein
MMGQWLGKYAGTSTRTLVVDLDDMGTHYEDRVYIYDDNPGLPSAFANVKTENKEPEVQLRLQLLPIDPRSGDATTWNQLASFFHDWRTNIETTGSAQLPRTRSDTPTDYVPLPNVSNWAEFKSFVGTLDHRRYIFRGQKERMRLRTSFHRTRRADLINFVTNDLQTLHRHLSLRTSHVFNAKGATIVRRALREANVLGSGDQYGPGLSADVRRQKHNKCAHQLIGNKC